MNVFELVAESYERYRKPRPQIINHIVKHIKAASLGNGRVLDLGCGTGEYASKIGGVFDTIIHGVDSSYAMLSIASGKENVRTIRCNCNEPFDLPSDFFICAYCVNFIHYIKNLSSFFSSIRKSLKEGGIIYIATHSEKDIRQQTLGHYFPATIPIELKLVHALDDLTSGLYKNGYLSVKVESISIKQPLTEEYLNACKIKTYNCLNYITLEEFTSGLNLMERDISNGEVDGYFPYTVITGVKRG